ncbi:GATA transcription factor 11-like isoform X1 [Hibiscus syriacus]|uniref:GATA transcription factor 11-like isoform X1 n=1 Tax=Hibiscus syriacus TaxID=106335 RepID=UPI00192072F5|nr:GATA transcription factor 11-like isoform X1 [Hibiscus syriacus]
MNNSWFDKGFNGVGVNDDFFDDIMEYLDLPFKEVEGDDCHGSKEDVKKNHLPAEENNDGDEEWDCNFENLEPPPTNVLVGLSSGFYGDFFSDSLEKSLTISCDGSSELNQQSSDTISRHPDTRRSITLHNESTDVKGSTWFQTSSPVSELESSSSCSGANPAPHNPELSFTVKRGRSKIKPRPASTYILQSTLPSISSASFASRGSNYLVGSESESESHLTERYAKKRQKKKKNLTLFSSSSEIKKSCSQQPIVIMKCMHCEITETSQWREGPMGPKTLCNACGVRYRSGRLFPEYRPAASPTFIPSLHSNSHKKVVEMRKKAKLPLSNPPKMSFQWQ